jgi:chromatin remodeling complex protein RSC6
MTQPAAAFRPIRDEPRNGSTHQNMIGYYPNEDNYELLPILRELRGGSAGEIGWQPNAAFTRLLHPDADLAAIAGRGPMSRYELGKRVWDYIRENNLQDSADRKIINADDRLAKILDGKRQAQALEVTNHVLKHVT